jgi:hypothetical protein
MKNINRKLLIPCLLLVVMASCKFSPNNINVPNWNVNLLGPLVNTSASGNNIVQINSLSGTASVSLKQLGYTNTGFVTVPAIPPINLQPFHFQFFNAFQSLTLASGTMNFILTNNLPVILRAGAHVVIMDSVSRDSIFSVTIPVDIAGYGGTYMMPTGKDMSGITIENNLNLIATNLSTDSSAGPITVAGNESFSVKAFISNPTFQSCVLYNDSASFRDTAAFSLQGSKVKTDVQSGTITTFITNNLPVDINLQFYFMLDDRATIIDSLFDNPAFIPARISAAIPSKDSVETTITPTKLSNMNEARYIVSSFKVKNVTSGVVISKTDSINFLLVGNLQVQLN